MASTRICKSHWGGVFWLLSAMGYDMTTMFAKEGTPFFCVVTSFQEHVALGAVVSSPSLIWDIFGM